jgi:hypothetical protein
MGLVISSQKRKSLVGLFVYQILKLYEQAEVCFPVVHGRRIDSIESMGLQY